MLILEELNLYANAKIAKWIATCMVLFFICYHGFLHAIDGGDSCQRLLSDGRFQGSQVWQPYGCMIHSYSSLDSRRCMRYVAFLKENNHIVFIGDSRIRQLYYAMVKEVATNPPPEPIKAHEDLQFIDSNLFLKIEFFWRPFMDESVQKLLNTWKVSPMINAQDRKKILPKLVVIGSGTHTIKMFNGSTVGFEQFQTNLTSIKSTLHHVGNYTKVLWMVQDPVFAERLAPARMAVTNDQIDLYNKAAMEILREAKVHLWSSSRLIAQGSLNTFMDGIHAGPVALKYDMQILLNLYCNDHLNYNDGTCCNSREGFTMTQITVFASLCTCSIIMIVVALKQWLCTGDNSEGLSNHHVTSYCSSEGGHSKHPSLESFLLQKEPIHVQEHSAQEIFMAIGKLGLIMGYFFLCDRTSLFMKENKYFSQLNFWLPLGYIFALGLFFTEDSSHTRLLHRNMTHEWKGWMQLVILIYHMTGASQVLPIYLHVRILVSCYLFLSGYGHFSFYWSGRDMGFVRYFQVMFRLNFLTVVLCLIMNRPYQFYYYVPIVSFWYTIFHITMALPPRLKAPSHANSEHSPVNYFYCIIKFICLGGFITVLYLSEVFFEKIFVVRLWRSLFVTADDDIHEWWFRWKLDRYSLLYGMCFGLIYQGLTQYGLIDDKSGSNLLGGRLAFLASLLGFLFSGSYAILTPLCKTKEQCNEVHPYMVWLPIAGYLTLRNLLGLLRTRYSTFFAWFGKVSLELFVCQYHIWLAADTHGVLVLIPSYPVANILVTSFIFLCACHEIHKITKVLVTFVVPYDFMKVVRNFTVFLVFLIAFTVNDGLF